MKSQTKLAVVVAVLSLAGAARAAEYVDLGTAQQRAEEGVAPAGATQVVPLAASVAPTSHQIGEAQQQAEAGVGYTPVRKTADVAGAPTPSAQVSPTFGIGEAQQIAESGEGYTPAASADHVAGRVASIQ